jgi:hypothetical protein
MSQIYNRNNLYYNMGEQMEVFLSRMQGNP